ncbi:MAG TPA: hypothetical protein DEF43_04850 [Chloroflexus aurantiacus]|jgi:hypothetical protein|uniref:Uncharacterized protein n=1 Tax=Chloroflexus aurantiacus (strain ATCC 29366 / DSM 635 / J-10-fl) TaxID=324602 RepID=A9WEZ7_CHLAA|nr:hypothetical protein [Chloroflexus aurantiacus]ABY35312.1 hypothetical protein Caur_2100 [Chloroflexus aurantiacus J-10-fl]RMG46001.1 MAG: hypothetical protein D6716_18965 [Chloroflexota bacterium]HBW66488.1 hypothetical protein [Chloroflexus aurantiacus]
MWRDEAYLLDMLIAARKTCQFVAGLSWEEFQRSSLHQHVVARVLEHSNSDSVIRGAQSLDVFSRRGCSAVM